jgi:hypothetical protein
MKWYIFRETYIERALKGFKLLAIVRMGGAGRGR